jgi:uncharacterized protein
MTARRPSADHGVIPFHQFVLKVHSRCDLACDHCYVYEHADQGWRRQPTAISPRTGAQVAKRIAEHAEKHRLESVSIVLHGGEPLLLGVDRTAELLATLQGTIESRGVTVDLRIHTNGVLLDETFLDLFARHGVKVGVSLDGDRQANDRHRLYRDGRSSYDKVVAALRLLGSPAYRHLYAGLLCTIDIRNDAGDVLDGLLAHEPPRIDLLLPHATWDSQPPNLLRKRTVDDPGRGGLPDGAGEYGAWLTRFYDLWDKAGQPVPVRLFDSVVAGLHGRPSQTESLGLAPIDLLVVETDGSLEQADTLKTAYDGAPATGLNVFDHDFDAAVDHPGVGDRQSGLDGLSEQCRSCPVVRVCGGGLYAHRYSPVTGFDNPSVYCRDLSDLIHHVEDTIGVRTVSSADTQPAPATHELGQDEFDALAAGHGSADTIRRLAAAQESLRRNLVARIAEFGPQQDKRFTHAWDLLAALDVTHPAAVARVLAHPYVRVWAVRHAEPPRDDRALRDLAHLGSLAAVAALYAGVDAELTLPVFDSSVRLPSLGALVLDPGPAEADVSIRADGTMTVRTGTDTHRLRPVAHGELEDSVVHPRWQALRTISADGLTVTLEDTDPYRDCHGAAADRLDEAEWRRWAEEFEAAIAFTDARLPH